MKEAKRFYSSLGLLVLLNVIIKPLWIFGIDRTVQNEIGIEAYGTYFSILNLGIVLSFLLDWGLTAYFNSRMASDSSVAAGSKSEFIYLKLLFALVYTAVLFFVALLSGIRRWDILAGVCLVQVFTSLFVFFRSIITAAQWFRAEAWLSVIDKTMMIIVCGSFLLFPLVFGSVSILKFIWAQVFCTAIATAITILVLRWRNMSFTLGKISLDKKVLINTIPYGLIVLFMSAHYRLDGFLLERIHINGAAEAGIYASAYRLLDAANMICFLFVSLLLPYVAKLWSERKDITETVLTVRHLLILYGIVAVATVLIAGNEIQQLLYHRPDSYSVEVLQWCMAALPGYVLVHIYGTVLTATGNVRAFCLANFLAVIVNVLLNLALIPVLGAKGCGIAAVISQYFCGVLTMILVQRNLSVGIGSKAILAYIFIAATWLSAAFLSHRFDLEKGWVVGAGLIISVLILLAADLFTAFKRIPIFSALSSK